MSFQIIGAVSQSGQISGADGKPYTFSDGSPVNRVVIEGFNMVPGNALNGSLPPAGIMIKGVVQSIFKSAKGDRKGGVTFLLTSWKELD